MRNLAKRLLRFSRGSVRETVIKQTERRAYFYLEQIKFRNLKTNHAHNFVAGIKIHYSHTLSGAAGNSNAI